MTGAEVSSCSFGWWWVFPIAMIVLCIFMARRRGGSFTGCCAPRRSEHLRSTDPTDSAREILDKRYASGEISREEYEEKKTDLDVSS